MHPCPACGREWPSKLAAAECCDPCWDDLLVPVLIGEAGPEAVIPLSKLTKESPRW
jgi:hypothetical protein